MTDRTPLILAALDDLLRERIESHPDDADLLALADGVALAVDHGEAARLWPVTGHDQSDAEVIIDVLLDDVTNGREAHLRATTAVARRLADVAASMLVRGDVMRREAESLWGAASRLLGLQAPRDSDHSVMLEQVDSLERDRVAFMSMLRDKDARIEALLSDLAKARGTISEPKAHKTDAVGLHITATGEIPPVSLRERVIWAGAKDCMTFIEDKKITLVVDMGHDREAFADIERRVRATLPLSDDKTYVFRELRQ